MRHERETLEAVISARNQAVGGLQKAAQDPGNAEAIRGLANAQRLAREWDTAQLTPVESLIFQRATKDGLRLKRKIFGLCRTIYGME